MSDTFLERLVKDAKEAQEAYYDDASDDNYNKSKRIIKTIAQHLLLDKALHGSTTAIIELEKSYHLTQPIKTEDQLLTVEDITLDQIDVFEKTLLLCKNKDKFKLTSEVILQKYEEGDISIRKMQELMKIIELAKKSENYGKLQGNFNIILSQDTADAIRS